MARRGLSEVCVLAARSTSSEARLGLRPVQRFKARKTGAAVDDRVPGEIKRSRDLRGGRWSWTLKLAQKRS